MKATKHIPTNKCYKVAIDTFFERFFGKRINLDNSHSAAKKEVRLHHNGRIVFFLDQSMAEEDLVKTAIRYSDSDFYRMKLILRIRSH